MENKGLDRNRHRKWYILNARSVSLLVVLILAILFYVALNHLQAIRGWLDMFTSVLMPFIAGFAIAYLLNTPMCFFERKLFSKLRFKRALSILLVYLIAFGVVLLLLGLILPHLVQSIMDLATNIEYYLTGLSDLIEQVTGHLQAEDGIMSQLIGSSQDYMKRFADTLSKILPGIFDSVVAVASGIITGITAVISSIYMLAEKERMARHLKKLLYAIFTQHRVARVLEVCGYANRVFVGFINGKLLDSAIIGVLCFFLCLILRIPYTLLVAIVVGVTNIIPFFGPFIGSIPCLIILVIVEPWAALRFLIMVIALQQFDGNILGPKILGDSTGLSAIWVLIAIVVGGGLFGVIGMILGVPAFAVLYRLVGEWVNKRLRTKGITEWETQAESSQGEEKGA